MIPKQGLFGCKIISLEINVDSDHSGGNANQGVIYILCMFKYAEIH